MRKVTLLIAAVCLIAFASPALAVFTGSLYYTTFDTHHVFRLDVAGGVPGATTDLAGLPGADGIIFDPLNQNELLVGGQLTQNIYGVSVFGGALGTANASPIVGGSFHLTPYVGQTITAKGYSSVGVSAQILTSGQEGPTPNAVAIVDLPTGNVSNRVIAGMGASRASSRSAAPSSRPTAPASGPAGRCTRWTCSPTPARRCT